MSFARHLPLVLALSLLAGCSSAEEEAEAEARRAEREAAVTASYKAWTTNVEARQREAQARRAAAEAEDLGPPPALEALKGPVEGWLKVHLGDLSGSDLVWAPAASKTVIEVGGAPRAAWAYEVALSPGKGPWELHKFALREGKVLSAVKVPAGDAEPRLKELLGVSY